MSKIDVSIILISENQVVRADFEGRHASRLIDLVREKRNSNLSAQQVLESVVQNKKSIGRKTLVLDTSIWSQIVSVPRLSVADVAPEELGGALKFEVETLSGVEAERAVLGIREIESAGSSGSELFPGQPATGQQDYWVNVATLESVKSVTKLAKARGAWWVGLAHPAGSYALRNRDQNRHIEIWDNLVFLFNRYNLQSISSRSGNWPVQWGVDTPTDQSDTLGMVAEHAGLLPESLAGRDVTVLDGEALLTKWLHNVARCVAKQELDDFLPIVVETREPANFSQRTILARVALAALTIAFCLGHYGFLNHRQNNIEQRIFDLKQPGIAKQGYDNEITEILNERSKLEPEAAKIKQQLMQIEFLFNHQTGRLEQFLGLLMASRTSDLVIENISTHEKGLVVKGTSLGGRSAPLMASRLREQVLSLGWRVTAPTQIGEQKMVSGGPWRFTILFEDVGPGVTLSELDPPASKINVVSMGVIPRG